MYMPREAFDPDALLGEDPGSQFTLAVPIEVYVNNVQNFEGEGDFLSKFNLEIRDNIKLSIARRRWNQIKTEKLQEEVGYTYQVETADTGSHGNTVSYVLETGTANGYSITSSRPREGDLIWIPFVNQRGALYEIKFVEHEAVFYQHGKLYTYELTCDLFPYSSERIRTGNTEIDSVETRYTADILTNQFILESSSDRLLDEDDGWILQEFRLENTVFTANNEVITSESLDFIDFSEQNPFSETRVF